MAEGHHTEGGRSLRGGIKSRDDIRFVAECVERGVSDALTLLQSDDPELLLAAQAVNEAAAQVRTEQNRELAGHIIHALNKAFST